MPAVDDDDKPKKKIAHEIGQDLTLLSAGELAERIALLKDEIARLEADMGEETGGQIGRRRFFQKVNLFNALAAGNAGRCSPRI